jgi:hypothetical protein
MRYPNRSLVKRRNSPDGLDLPSIRFQGRFGSIGPQNLPVILRDGRRDNRNLHHFPADSPSIRMELIAKIWKRLVGSSLAISILINRWGHFLEIFLRAPTTNDSISEEISESHSQAPQRPFQLAIEIPCLPMRFFESKRQADEGIDRTNRSTRGISFTAAMSTCRIALWTDLKVRSEEG